MRWRILDKRIGLNLDSVDLIVEASVCLHNFLSTMNDTDVTIENYKLAQEAKGLDTFQNNNEMLADNLEGSYVREILTKYFVSPEGGVPWQLERVRKGLNSNVRA